MLPRRPTGVVCAGNLVLDILVRPVGDINWGTTTWVDSIEQHVGGNGANTSYALAKLGVPVRLLGAVGNDAFGDQVLSKLREAGVDLGAVARSDTPTATTVGLVKADGARSFLHRPGVSREVFPEPVAFGPEIQDGLSHFHLANVFSMPLMRCNAPETLRRAKSAGFTTSLDTGWDARDEWMGVLGPCLEYLDLLFVNQDEARMLSGRQDAEESAHFFRSRGARAVVAKLGDTGCAVFGPGEEIFAPAFPVQVVDTTGAGDCFAGGYLAALSRGRDCREAARFANAVGALSIGKLGAVGGLLTFAETDAWIAAHS